MPSPLSISKILGAAIEDVMQKIFANPEELPCWPDFFSNIVTVKGSGVETIYLAGQVGVDNNKKLVGEGDLAAQTAQAFENLATALATVGATTTDVVKTTIFVVNYKPDDAAVIGEVIGKYFPDQKPACSLVGVQSLAVDMFLIEVEAIAVRENHD
jgi:enamine deaminase RidA (YjgF/YER057c/UK114 family)